MQCTDRRTVGGNLLDIIASHDDSSFFAGACRSADLVQAAGEEMRSGKEILLMLLAGYACFLFQITFYNREEGSRSGIFTHISMWLKSGSPDLSNQMIYDLLNVCLFVPWGALIALFRGREKIGRKLFLTTCYSFLTSFCIEVIQLLTHRGYFELMDILTNVTGGILGGLATVILYVIVPAQGKTRSNHG